MGDSKSLNSYLILHADLHADPEAAEPVPSDVGPERGGAVGGPMRSKRAVHPAAAPLRVPHTTMQWQSKNAASKFQTHTKLIRPRPAAAGRGDIENVLTRPQEKSHIIA